MTEKKSPTQLIEERAQEMDEMGMYGPEYGRPMKYYCMSTGLPFMCYGESPGYSPYTGGMDVEPAYEEEAMGEQTPAEFQKPTSIPGNQKDPHRQVPLSPNPAPAQPGAASWQNKPWAGNPAPDAQGTVGADQAGPRGFVTYPQQSMQPGKVPPHVNMQPGKKT